MEQQIDRAEKILERLLVWVGRHDARSAVILSVNIAMIGATFLADKNVIDWSKWAHVTGFAAGSLISLSLWYIYRTQTPRTDSPNRSLIYFGQIADRSREGFSTDFRAMSDEQYLEDLLHQCHVNSEILTAKFYELRIAMFFTVTASPFWLTTLLLIR